MNEEIENLEIEVSTMRERNRILTMRLDDLAMKFKHHVTDL